MYRLPIAYGFAVAGLCAAILSVPEPGMEEIRAVIRATALTSAIPFLAVFTASPLHRLRPSAATRWLMANRRYLGLSVAASHLWHLAAIIAFVTRSPATGSGVDTLTLVFGTGGFVLIALMAATSNDASQRALGRGWSVLHTFGLYLVWLDFIFTYSGPALASPFHALMTGTFAAAWALRVFARAATRPAVSRA